MVSFMSGLPRIKPNMGRVVRASAIKGFVDNHFKKKAEKIRKEEADRKFDLDQELLNVRKIEADNRRKEFDLKLKNDKINQDIANKTLRQEAGYVALPGFKYLNEDGEMTDFEYIKGDEDSAQNSLAIIKQVENFLDPNAVNAKNIQQAIIENGSPFEDLVIKHMDNLSKMQEFKIGDEVLGSKTLMPLVTPLDKNGVTNIDQYTNLINTFKTLKSKNMSFLDYAKNLQETSLSSAGYNLKDLDNNPVYYTLDENNNLVIYNKDPAAVKGFTVEGKNVGVANNMFNTETSENEKSFKEKLYILKSSDVVGTDRNTVIMASSLLDPEVSKAIGFNKINQNSSATGSDMINLAASLSQMATQINPDEKKSGIRSVKNTSLKTDAVVSAYYVNNADRFYNLRQDRGETIITLNPVYANNIINLKDSSNTKIKQENATFFRIGKEGVDIINQIYQADDEIAGIKGGDPYRLGNRVTGASLDTFAITKNIVNNIATAVGNFTFKNQKIKDDLAADFAETEALRNAAINGDATLLQEGTTGLGAANNARAKKNVEIAYNSYNNTMNNLAAQLQDPNSGMTEEIYAARARAEGLKVRLAFKMASLVQGGGTGGRTISNQDYEVIIKSLYGNTNTSFRESLDIVRNSLFKSMKKAEIFKRYAHTGTQDEMMNIADAYIDADFNRLTGTKFDSNSNASMEKFDEARIGNKTTNLRERSNIALGPNTYTQIGTFEEQYGMDPSLVEIFRIVAPSQSLDTEGKVFMARANGFQGLVKGILIPSIIKDRQDKGVDFSINSIQNDLTGITGNEQLANKMASKFFQDFSNADLSNPEILDAIMDTTITTLIDEKRGISNDTMVRGQVIDLVNTYNMKKAGITQITGTTLPPMFEVTQEQFGQKGNPRTRRVIKVNINDKVKQELNEFISSNVPADYDSYLARWNDDRSKGVIRPKMSFPEFRNKRVANKYGIPEYAFARPTQRANITDSQKLGAEALDALLESIGIDPYRG